MSPQQPPPQTDASAAIVIAEPVPGQDHKANSSVTNLGLPQDAAEIAAALAAPFEIVFTDTRGGVEIAYVDGEQVTRRLNDVLGAHGWSFRVLRDGLNLEADEYWCLGELEAVIAGVRITKQQYGSNKVKRAAPNCGNVDETTGEVCADKRYDHDKRHRDHKFTPGPSGPPLDIGFDLKGAGTDALKKCASLLGIGLYLSRKDANPDGSVRRPSAHELAGPGNKVIDLSSRARAGQNASARSGRAAPTHANIRSTAQEATGRGDPSIAATTTHLPPAQTHAVTAEEEEAVACGYVHAGTACKEKLKPVEFATGEKWTVVELAAAGREAFGRTLCYSHYKRGVEAGAAKAAR